MQRSTPRLVRGGRRGIEMLEFAIAGPITLFVLFMVISFSIFFEAAFNTQSVLSTTAMEVAASGRFTAETKARCEASLALAFTNHQSCWVTDATGNSVMNQPGDTHTLGGAGSALTVHVLAEPSTGTHICLPATLGGACVGPSLTIERQMTIQIQGIRGSV